MTTNATDATAPEPLTQEGLRRALSGHIDAVRVPLAYRAGLLLVTIATVLLPVAYLALAGLAAWGVVYHALHNHWILTGSGGLILRAIGYLGPIVVGGVVVFFMFKPLLARSTSRPSDLEILPSRHPLVFALVNGISRAVGAPSPSRIAVDCEVNASASFRRGLASLLGHDLQLTIGLPLAAGLTLRQLAGVLAHEMGHFAQGSGMRLTYLIRSVNGWLARVVFERDEWDEKLAEWSENSDGRVAIVLVAARFGVWLSRGILHLLMLAGHAIGTLMLRQMEYDADRYEARLAGSDTFASTAFAMRRLSLSSLKATSALSRSYGEGRLADDYPAMVAATEAGLSQEERRDIERLDDAGPGRGIFDTHPPDGDRIRRARAEHTSGIFRLEQPAGVLFGDLPALCREATEMHYGDRHGIDLGRVTLEPVTNILAHQDVVDQDLEAYERVFGALVGMQRPLGLGGELPPRAVDVAVVVGILEKSRAPLRGLADSTRSSGDAVRAAGRQAMELTAAHAVLAAGYPPPALSKGPSPSSAEVAERGAERAQERLRAAAAEQEPARDALRDRVRAALSLLGTTSLEGQVGPGATIQMATNLVKAVSAVEELGPVITEMAQDSMIVEAFANLELVDQDDRERCFRRMSPRLGSLRQRTVGVLRELEAVPYPFEHAKGSLTLAAFVTDDMPPEDLEPTEFHHAAHVLGCVTDVFRRSYGRLAIMVEDVETALGLEPLEPPMDVTSTSG